MDRTASGRMKIRQRHGLLYVAATLTYRGQQLSLSDVLLDTGSAGSIFSADSLLTIDLVPEPLDTLRRIRGVGGVEFVFSKRVDLQEAGELVLEDFEIEVGALDYGFPVEGILGVDFLTRAGALIDLKNSVLRSA
jgi:hypothetical protein